MKKVGISVLVFTMITCLIGACAIRLAPESEPEIATVPAYTPQPTYTTIPTATTIPTETPIPAAPTPEGWQVGEFVVGQDPDVVGEYLEGNDFVYYEGVWIWPRESLFDADLVMYAVGLYGDPIEDVVIWRHMDLQDSEMLVNRLLIGVGLGVNSAVTRLSELSIGKLPALKAGELLQDGQNHIVYDDDSSSFIYVIWEE